MRNKLRKGKAKRMMKIRKLEPGEKVAATHATQIPAEELGLSLTMEKLMGIAGSIPRPSNFRWAAVKAEYLHRFREEMPKPTNALWEDYNLGGISLYVKTDQKMAAWLFSDEKLLDEYLTGKLSEKDLFTLQNCVRALKSMGS